MRTWTTPLERLRRSPRREARRRPQRIHDAQAVAHEEPDAAAPAGDNLLRELASAALLVERGLASRVVVCNAPATIDLAVVRLVAETFHVTVEPVVRVGGGGFDFAVSAGARPSG